MMTNREFIGITEPRMKHIVAVARKCYQIAKAMNLPEDECRRMWMMGYLHDVGFEFSEVPEEHTKIGADMLELIEGFRCSDVWQSIYRHGIHSEGEESTCWKILTMADLHVDSEGKEVTPKERLIDIETRYGKDSERYKEAYLICTQLGLIKPGQN